MSDYLPILDVTEEEEDTITAALNFNDFQPQLQSTALDDVIMDALNDDDNNNPDDSDIDNTTDNTGDDILSFFKGPRGGRNCSYNGHVYSHDRYKVNSDTHYWQCCRRKEFNPQCRSRLYTKGNVVLRFTPHVHDISYDYVIKSQTLSKIKFSGPPVQTPSSVVSCELLTVPDPIKANLPTLPNLKRTVRRQRAKSYPSAPSSDSFHIPYDFSVDGQNRRFLLSDIHTPSQKRLLIYSTDSCLDAMQDRQADIAYIDGTFKTSPHGFVQTWVVRSSLHDEALGTLRFNSAYCFLPDKTLYSYSTALGELKRVAPLWRPTAFVCDFEQNEHKAILEHFPGSDLWGCHFHYDKCLLLHFKKLGSVYREDESLRTLLQHLYALPFVPTADVPTAWNSFSTELTRRYPTAANVIIPYFNSTWMTGQYPLQIWNCHSRTLNKQPRTNNVSEGANNAIKSHFGCCDPTIWVAVKKLKEMQAATDLNLTQFFTRRWTRPSVSRKEKQRQQRILSMVQEYDRTDMMKYLKRLSYMFIM